MTTKETLYDVIEKIDAATKIAMKTWQDLATAQNAANDALTDALLALPEYINGYAVYDALENRLYDVEFTARSASDVAYFLCRSNDVLRHVATYYEN